MLNTQAMKCFGKELQQCTDEEIYIAALHLCQEKSKELSCIKGNKKLYYLSAEFLIGRLLACNLLNLGLWEQVQKELFKIGKNISTLEKIEPEPSLGNGGLGRLAACFMDSIATLGLPGDGIGLCYHFGLFKQRFENYKQTEYPDSWLTENYWLTDTSKRFSVQLGDSQTVTAKLVEIDVPGYENHKKNKLKLFDLETVDSQVIKKGIEFNKKDISHNLTLFLYPDDSDHQGRMLRIYQQYFLVSAAAQLILDELQERGYAYQELPQAVVIQINDTHPSMIIPELVRLLMQKGIPFDDAADLVTQTCGYTNHTILAEALEKWPLADLEEAVPLLIPVIKALDERVKKSYANPKVWIVDRDNLVHMAHMDIHYGMSVNGVASLHTEILKKSELKPFYEIYPEKFNNKTNGITFRRWLMACNPALSQWICSHIGEDWKKDPLQLEKLLELKDDEQALLTLRSIKKNCKQDLMTVLQKKGDIRINPDSIFDVQIKRLHEYKRQQMNLLYIIWKMLQIRAGNLPQRPITFFFGAKAAPAYTMAKDIIHALLCLSQVIQNDLTISPWLQIVFVENYNVSYAEKLIPAADISEQISLASKEASGTGNMKLMLNGALTLGTLDGANVEIADLVGQENIYLFGRHSEDVIQMYENESYHASEYAATELIQPLLAFILSDEMVRVGDRKSLDRLYQNLSQKDWFMTLLDLEDYIKVKEKMLEDYEDVIQWSQKAIVNIAKAGYFSSDRTIAEYNRDIWKL